MSSARFNTQKGLGLAIVLGLFVFEMAGRASGHGASAAPSPSPSVMVPPSGTVSPPAPSSLPSDAPSPLVSPSPSPSPAAPSQSLTQQEARELLSAFQRAQRNEISALDHRNQFEMIELKASHAARLREWESKERTVRHKFFAEHPKGADRRPYVQDYKKRQDVFRIGLKEELKTRKNEQDVRRKSLVEEQKLNYREFQEFIGHGERPPERLWPRAGG